MLSVRQIKRRLQRDRALIVNGVASVAVELRGRRVELDSGFVLDLRDRRFAGVVLGHLVIR